MWNEGKLVEGLGGGEGACGGRNGDELRWWPRWPKKKTAGRGTPVGEEERGESGEVRRGSGVLI